MGANAFCWPCMRRSDALVVQGVSTRVGIRGSSKGMAVVGRPASSPGAVSREYDHWGTIMDEFLTIAGKRFRSRLILGTGKYASPEVCKAALDASGAEIVTVAIRRLDLDNPNKQTELDYIDWSRYTILPNTAGCKTVEEALFTARLGRELTGSDWVKLEEIGCATVMPLGSATGSGQGILTIDEIKIIIEEAHVPVVVDAGVGAPSDAALAMEIGADAVLINTAVAKSQD